MAIIFIGKEAPTPLEQEVITENENNYETDIIHMTLREAMNVKFSDDDHVYVNDSMQVAMVLHNDQMKSGGPFGTKFLYPTKLLVDVFAETKEVYGWASL